MRILSSPDVTELLSYFPKTRLSYEVNVHKKDETYDDRCFIIPKGRRCVAWATEWKRQKIIAIIDIVSSNPKTASNNKIQNSHNKFYQENGWIPGQVTIYDVCFNGTLCYGSVFGGTIFKTSKQYSSHTRETSSVVLDSTVDRIQFSCFCIQNIYWYKGNSVSSLYLDSYLKMCEQIFLDRDILQVSYTSSGLIFGLPVFCNSENDAQIVIPSLPYNVYSLHFRSNTSHRIHQMVTMQKIYNQDHDKNNTSINNTVNNTVISNYKDYLIKTNSACNMSKIETIEKTPILRRFPFVKPNDDMLTNIQAVFMIRPNVQNDIYELYVKSYKSPLSSTNADHLIFHNFAHIPNYKTSVMMNTIFRKIKENARLDSMEESDDDEEFENIEHDKFVSLQAEYKMICRLNKKFCKWVPIQIVATESVSSSMSQDIITESHVKQHEVRYLPKKYVPRKQ